MHLPRASGCRVLAIGLMALSPLLVHADGRDIQISIAPSIRTEPYTGRVYVFTTQREDVEPRNAMSWFRPEPILAMDVSNWRGEALIINSHDPRLFRYPKDWSALELTGRRVQAVARFNPWDRNVDTGPGNGFSNPVQVQEAVPLNLVIDQVVREAAFPSTSWSREFVVRSELLSRFHGRDIQLRAAVNLPPGYAERTDRRFPVLFNIPGFGGTHAPGSTHWYRRRGEHPGFTNTRNVEFIEVVLDPSCPLGHHVFADSDNNGPWGTALVSELIPALNAAFRTDPRSEARFLTGHSSGGWSSLWLQVRYPETFGGVWSTSPDPVDFRDFQRIDIYRTGENMYRDHHESRRPLARRGEQALLWYDGFTQLEDVLGYGGQLHSFEAVFSPAAKQRRQADLINRIDAPPGPHPQPELLWNRSSGAIDPGVAESWKRYDIRLILEENWPTLGPKLKGKLHVFMGTQDTFYLEGATRLLQESLKNLGSDAVVELVVGRDHGNLLDAALRKRIEQEMADAYISARGK